MLRRLNLYFLHRLCGFGRLLLCLFGRAAHFALSGTRTCTFFPARRLAGNRRLVPRFFRRCLHRLRSTVHRVLGSLFRLLLLLLHTGYLN